MSVVDVSDRVQCSFCGRENDRQVTISSPDHPGFRRGRNPADRRHYICHDCVATCNTAITQVTCPSGYRPTNAAAVRVWLTGCSFCHSGPEVVGLVPAPGDPPRALICEICLGLCTSMIEERSMW